MQCLVVSVEMSILMILLAKYHHVLFSLFKAHTNGVMENRILMTRQQRTNYQFSKMPICQKTLDLKSGLCFLKKTKEDIVFPKR